MTTFIPYLTLPSSIFASPAASILLPIAAGTAVGFSTQPQKTQKTYLEIRQPPLRPPPWIFGPTWTILYGLMGYASHRAWTTGLNSFDADKVLNAQRGATLYSIQIGLNLIWMPLFFGYGQVGAATADILALTGTVGYLAYIWSQVDEVAAYCLVPYLGWLGFASYLTIGVGHLNGWTLDKKERED